jgi:putative hydrolase
MSEDEPYDGGAGDREEELRELLRKLLSGEGDIDASRLAEVAGLPADPAMLQQLMAQLQGAIRTSGDGVNWSMALDQARGIAQRTAVVTLPEERTAIDTALGVAALWLSEATAISDLTSSPRLMSRTEWVTETMPVWSELAEPVVASIADALAEVLQERAPEEFAELGLGGDPSSMVRGIGNTLFAMQLGAVIGQLSTEVVSGGDVGVPLLANADGEAYAAIVPQNVHSFASGLDIPADQVQLYLAVRELAHARLFRHARWLRLQVLATIGEAAHGVGIDMSSLEDAVSDFDPQNPESLRAALSSGQFISRENDEQLAKLETTLALIEGWVDVVTAAATVRLPKSDAIAETVRRRRATGGPAESAFASLVGLELRPRRLREAASMWQQLTDAVGAEKRDALWSHPDLMPTAEDIDDPAALIARVTGGAPEPDAIDRAIEDLLGDIDGDRPTE